MNITRIAGDTAFAVSDRDAARRLYTLFHVNGWTRTERGWANPQNTAIVEWGDDPRAALVIHDPTDTARPPLRDRIYPVDTVAQAVGFLVVLQLLPGIVATEKTRLLP